MAAPRFSVGQRVRFRRDVKLTHPKFAGRITTIDSIKRFDLKERQWVYRILISGVRGAHENSLEPLHDGYFPSTWSRCIWQPITAKDGFVGRTPCLTNESLTKTSVPPSESSLAPSTARSSGS